VTRRVLLLLFFLFALTSCAKKPTMKLNHAELAGGSVTIGFPPQASVLMTCVVDVYNPNSYDVAVRAMRGNVKFAGKYDMPITFQGPPDGVWLPADQTTPLRVPVAIPVSVAIQLMRDSFNVSTIDFQITGKADVTATRTFKIEKDDYEVDEKGTITRDQMDAAIRSVIPFGGFTGPR
jgi:hypothetical protein